MSPSVRPPVRGRHAATRRRRERRLVAVSVLSVAVAMVFSVALGQSGTALKSIASSASTVTVETLDDPLSGGPGQTAVGPSSSVSLRPSTAVSATPSAGVHPLPSQKAQPPRPVPLASVPDVGGGRIALLPKVPGSDSRREGRAVRYSLSAERGLQADLTGFGAHVRRALSDDRGWEKTDGVHFVYVPPERVAGGAAVDLKIMLVSPSMVDKLCAPLQTRGHVSCRAGDKIVLNVRRWLGGTVYYGDNLLDYRTYLVNHEVGHGLGHGHVGCPAARADAPIMMQQTIKLDGCRPWPYPAKR